MRAKDWCKTQGRTLFDYEPVGVNIGTKKFSTQNPKIELLKKFIKEVPNNAEVLVDYRFNISLAGGGANVSYAHSAGYASGTALILKNKL